MEGALEILLQERKLFKKEKWKKQYFRLDKQRKILEQKNFSMDEKFVDCYDISQIIVEDYTNKPLSLTIFVFSEKEKKSKTITLCAYSMIDYKNWKTCFVDISPNSPSVRDRSCSQIKKKDSFISSNNCDENSPLPMQTTRPTANIFCTTKQSRLQMRHVEEWSMYDVQDLLSCIRAENEDHSTKPRKTMLELYGNDFLSNDIDGLTLEMLTEEALQIIGVHCISHRKKLFQLIEQLKTSRTFSLKNHYFLKKLECFKVNVWNGVTDAQEEQLCKLIDKDFLLNHYLSLQSSPFDYYQQFLNQEDGIHVILNAGLASQGQEQMIPFSIKLRLTNVRHSDECKSINHILSPFCCSIPSIRNDTSLFPAGEIMAVLVVGPFLLEWSSSCVVVPKKLCQSMQFFFETEFHESLLQDYEIIIQDQEQVNGLLSKLAEFIADWNATKLYTSYKLPIEKENEIGPKYNCIDFIEQCLQYLNLQFPSIWTKNSGVLFTVLNPMEVILKELRSNGKLESVIYKPSAAMAKRIANDYVTAEEGIQFTKLEQVLQLIDTYFVEEQYRRDYFIDYYLLKSYSTCFWLVHFTNGKPNNLLESRQDHPLIKHQKS